MGRKTKQNKITSPELIAQINPENIRLIGWESLEMVGVYKDIDEEEEIGRYFADGEVVGAKQKGIEEL